MIPDLADAGLFYREVQLVRNTWLWKGVLVGDAISAVLGALIFFHPAIRSKFTSGGISDLQFAIFGAVWLLIVVLNPVIFYHMKFVTEVRHDGLRVRYFPFDWRWKDVPLDGVYSVNVLALGDMRGGFGRMRRTATTAVYASLSRAGVRIDYTDGRRVYIGSRFPEDLRDAISKVLSISTGASPGAATC